MFKEKLIQKQPLAGKIAIACGASTGIGKASAKAFVQLGGSVCIVARNQEKLKKAVADIESVKTNDDQFVEMISCDTSDMEKLKPFFDEFIKNHGIPDYLFNFVGYAIPDYVENLKLEDFKKHIDVNYYGQLVPTLIMLPHFMEARKGYITFTSSLAYFYPVMGYAMYEPAKSAIVGLAKTLRNEIKPYNIKVGVLYPSDTNTPSFVEENKTKPEECVIQSGMSKIFEPEEIAEPFIKGILKGKFNLLPGFIAKAAWWFYRHFPKLIYWLTDKDLKKARKKLGKK